METKKAPHKDMNRKRGMFFNFGMILTLVLVISAFEYKFYDDLAVIDVGTLEKEPEEMIDIPIIKQSQPPAQKIVSPIVTEIENDVDIKKVEMEMEEFAEETAPKEIEKPKLPETKQPIPEEVIPEIFIIVENPAEPKDGMKKFYEYIGKHIEYPKQARRMGIEGRVFVQFVIERDGSLTDIQVIKGIGAGCDEEAVRVLKTAPKWNPAKQRGKTVKQRMSIPIYFKLN